MNLQGRQVLYVVLLQCSPELVSRPFSHGRALDVVAERMINELGQSYRWLADVGRARYLAGPAGAAPLILEMSRDSGAAAATVVEGAPRSGGLLTPVCYYELGVQARLLETKGQSRHAGSVSWDSLGGRSSAEWFKALSVSTTHDDDNSLSFRSRCVGDLRSIEECSGGSLVVTDVHRLSVGVRDDTFGLTPGMSELMPYANEMSSNPAIEPLVHAYDVRRRLDISLRTYLARLQGLCITLGGRTYWTGGDGVVCWFPGGGQHSEICHMGADPAWGFLSSVVWLDLTHQSALRLESLALFQQEFVKACLAGGLLSGVCSHSPRPTEHQLFILRSRARSGDLRAIYALRQVALVTRGA